MRFMTLLIVVVAAAVTGLGPAAAQARAAGHSAYRIETTAAAREALGSGPRAAHPRTAGPAAWIEQRVAASDPAVEKFFGFSVLVQGDTAFIGAPSMGRGPGRVYVLTRTNGVWNQTQVLTGKSDVTSTPPNWQNFFGWSMAVSGDTLVVGALQAWGGSGGPFGAAYIFTRSSEGWTQTAELQLTDGRTPSRSFGYAVAISGNTLVIGSPYPGIINMPLASYEGRAYVYTQSDGQWSMTQELAPSDAAAPPVFLDFGRAIAFDGTTLMIGAPGTDGCSPYPACYAPGVVYAFADTDGSWTQVQRLTASDGVVEDRFGISLAISGDTALIGASRADIGQNVNQGAAYVFDKANGVWAQGQKLVAPDGVPYDQFGLAVALDGAIALVGEWSDGTGDHPPPPKAGVAYEFSATDGDWSLNREFTASQGALDDLFGKAVAVDGDTLLIGEPDIPIGDNPIGGAAYLYGGANLALSLSAPAGAEPGKSYLSQAIVTNNAATASPPVAVTLSVPVAATFVSARATQGSCNQAAGRVTCNFGQISGNAGTAKAEIELKPKGSVGTVVRTVVGISRAIPPITASAATQVDTAPVAEGGKLVTMAATPATGTLQATDADGDSLTFAIVAQAKHGKVSLDDASKGTYTYTPAADYVGSDSFSFKANDGILDSAPAVVTITVKASNHPPVAENGSLTTAENEAANGTLSASDPDGDALTFSIVTQPEYGKLTLDDASTGAYSYTPAEDYSGADSFDFKANDGQADSNTATVTITVKAVKPPPPSSGGGNDGGGATAPLGLALMALVLAAALWRRRIRVR